MVTTPDEKAAKENRLRLFREQADLAMKEVAQQDLSVRKNMLRLRELRLAKEAEAALVTHADPAGKRAPGKRRVRRDD
jgi:hypothetical protein